MRAYDLITRSVIADEYGVSQQAVNKWSKVKDFPAPLVVTAAQALYDRAQVDEWCRVHSKVRAA